MVPAEAKHVSRCTSGSRRCFLSVASSCLTPWSHMGGPRVTYDWLGSMKGALNEREGGPK